MCVYLLYKKYNYHHHYQITNLIINLIYPGGRKADDIIAWLEKSTGPSVTELATAAEVKAFTDKTDVSVVGYFPNNETDEAKAYIGAADAGMDLDGINFALCINAETTKEMEAEVNTVVMYKKVSGSTMLFLFVVLC